MRRIWIVALLVLVAGCGNSTWHQKFDWNAEDYFDDPQVIALCKAIEANDLEEMEQLIQAGADVTATGKDNMTPLLWAFPDNKLERFKKLLEHGADPNVIVRSDFNTHSSGIRPGFSITHMACKTSFPGYFEAVFEHGGDPNLVEQGQGIIPETPIFKIVRNRPADQKERIVTLISLGADLDFINGADVTPCMQAVSWGEQFDLVLFLLEKGADWKVYQTTINARLAHKMIMCKRLRGNRWTPETKRQYDEVKQWLESQGESFEDAEKDLDRRQSWQSLPPHEYSLRIEAEIAERKRREAQKQPGQK
ncbi:ankyrin repeat domain-containing protein [Aeoliella mucimassa]|uniref:Ankyrin repeats (3 copies) n=1 Tax=Aeoliella mucimassa TaxID=2527972 RepID=A0A518AUC0_9BACT|nr:hypothetical protein [Aeoliella mucimassa]QDU58317.1 Ankyrin repeats (3 copies) [Aeoliella mucimassa]